MEFGRLDNVDRVKFTLPPDHPMTSEVLGKSANKKPQVFAGCPVWGDPKFVGRIYPKGTKAGDFLKVYSTKFNAIELNMTGYRIPTREAVEAWANTVAKGFVFSPKVSKQISNSNPLGKDDAALQRFCENVKALGNHLGPVFLQLAPHFSPIRLDQLYGFIERWDKTIPLHIELRHPDWFTGDTALNDLFSFMRKNKIGTVITDVTGRRDTLHQCLTTRTAFIRFDGHDLHPSDFKRLDEWAVRVKSWIDHGLEKVYFFVHTPKKYLNPELSNYFLGRMNALCGLDLKLAEIIKQPKSKS